MRTLYVIQSWKLKIFCLGWNLELTLTLFHFHVPLFIIITNTFWNYDDATTQTQHPQLNPSSVHVLFWLVSCALVSSIPFLLLFVSQIRIYTYIYIRVCIVTKVVNGGCFCRLRRVVVVVGGGCLWISGDSDVGKSVSVESRSGAESAQSSGPVKASQDVVAAVFKRCRWFPRSRHLRSLPSRVILVDFTFLLFFWRVDFGFVRLNQLESLLGLCWVLNNGFQNILLNPSIPVHNIILLCSSLLLI